MNSLPLLNRILKIIVVVALLFFGGVGLLLFFAIQKQDGKDRDFEKRLSPSIQFVEGFVAKNHRLPSDAEFAKRPSATADNGGIDITGKDSADPAFASHGGKTSRDFCVRVWRGEDWTYYFSWNKKYDIVEP